MNRRMQYGQARLSSLLVTVTAAAVVVMAGLGLMFVVTGGSGSVSPSDPSVGVGSDGAAAGEESVSLPGWVMASPPRVREAYLFAVERPDVMVWIPCYCGCGGHSGHKSAHNCFVKEGSSAAGIEFDKHGAGCEMCVGIALDSKAMIEEGRSLSDIRTYIDGEYGSIGPGTDTPLPPA